LRRPSAACSGQPGQRGSAADAAPEAPQPPRREDFLEWLAELQADCPPLDGGDASLLRWPHRLTH
jgi:hypothetical protein